MELVTPVLVGPELAPIVDQYELRVCGGDAGQGLVEAVDEMVHDGALVARLGDVACLEVGSDPGPEVDVDRDWPEPELRRFAAGPDIVVTVSDDPCSRAVVVPELRDRVVRLGNLPELRVDGS